LLRLLRQCAQSLFQFPTPPLVFRQWNDAAQIGFGEPVELMLKLLLAFA
jgi:hypothetical protein